MEHNQHQHQPTGKRLQLRERTRYIAKMLVRQTFKTASDGTQEPRKWPGGPAKEKEEQSAQKSRQAAQIVGNPSNARFYDLTQHEKHMCQETQLRTSLTRLRRIAKKGGPRGKCKSLMADIIQELKTCFAACDIKLGLVQPGGRDLVYHASIEGSQGLEKRLGKGEGVSWWVVENKCHVCIITEPKHIQEKQPTSHKAGPRAPRAEQNLLEHFPAELQFHSTMDSEESPLLIVPLLTRDEICIGVLCVSRFPAYAMSGKRECVVKPSWRRQQRYALWHSMEAMGDDKEWRHLRLWRRSSERTDGATVIQKIRKGWSASQLISGKVVSVRSHPRWGPSYVVQWEDGLVEGEIGVRALKQIIGVDKDVLGHGCTLNEQVVKVGREVGCLLGEALDDCRRQEALQRLDSLGRQSNDVIRVWELGCRAIETCMLAAKEVDVWQIRESGQIVESLAKLRAGTSWNTQKLPVSLEDWPKHAFVSFCNYLFASNSCFDNPFTHPRVPDLLLTCLDYKETFQANPAPVLRLCIHAARILPKGHPNNDTVGSEVTTAAAEADKIHGNIVARGGFVQQERRRLSSPVSQPFLTLPDVYVVASCNGKQVLRTSTSKGTSNPVWGPEDHSSSCLLSLTSEPWQAQVALEVWMSDVKPMDILVGQAILGVESLLFPCTGPQEFALKDEFGQTQGTIIIGLWTRNCWFRWKASTAAALDLKATDEIHIQQEISLQPNDGNAQTTLSSTSNCQPEANLVLEHEIVSGSASAAEREAAMTITAERSVSLPAQAQQLGRGPVEPISRKDSKQEVGQSSVSAVRNCGASRTNVHAADNNTVATFIYLRILEVRGVGWPHTADLVSLYCSVLWNCRPIASTGVQPLAVRTIWGENGQLCFSLPTSREGSVLTIRVCGRRSVESGVILGQLSLPAECFIGPSNALLVKALDRAQGLERGTLTLCWDCELPGRPQIATPQPETERSRSDHLTTVMRPSDCKGIKHALAIRRPSELSSEADGTFACQLARVMTTSLHRVSLQKSWTEEREFCLAQLSKVCQQWQSVSFDTILRVARYTLERCLPAVDAYFGVLECSGTLLTYVEATTGSRMRGQRLPAGQGISHQVALWQQPRLFNLRDLQPASKSPAQLEVGDCVFIRYGRIDYPGKIINYTGHGTFSVKYDEDGQREAGVPLSRLTWIPPQPPGLHRFGKAGDTAFPVYIVPLASGGVSMGVLGTDGLDRLPDVEENQGVSQTGVMEFLCDIGKAVGSSLDMQRKAKGLAKVAEGLSSPTTTMPVLAELAVSVLMDTIVFAQKVEAWEESIGEESVLYCVAKRGTFATAIATKQTGSLQAADVISQVRERVILQPLSLAARSNMRNDQGPVAISISSAPEAGFPQLSSSATDKNTDRQPNPTATEPLDLISGSRPILPPPRIREQRCAPRQKPIRDDVFTTSHDVLPEILISCFLSKELVEVDQLQHSARDKQVETISKLIWFVLYRSPAARAEEDTCYLRDVCKALKKASECIHSRLFRARVRTRIVNGLLETCREWSETDTRKLVLRVVEGLSRCFLGSQVYVGLLLPGGSQIEFVRASAGSVMEGKRLTRGQGGLAFKVVDGREQLTVKSAKSQDALRLHVFEGSLVDCLPMVSSPLTQGERVVRGILTVDRLGRSDDDEHPELAELSLLNDISRALGAQLDLRGKEKAMQELSEATERPDGRVEEMQKLLRKVLRCNVPLARVVRLMSLSLECVKAADSLDHGSSVLMQRSHLAVLHVRIAKCTGLNLPSCFSTSQRETQIQMMTVFVIMKAGQMTIATTPCVPANDVVCWNDTSSSIWYVVQLPEDRCQTCLQFEVWGRVTYGATETEEQRLAWLTLEGDLLLHTDLEPRSYRLQGHDDDFGMSPRHQSFLTLQIIPDSTAWVQCADSIGRMPTTVLLQLLSAHGLAMTDLAGSPDPCCIIKDGSGRVLGQTKLKQSTSSPAWEDEIFEVPIFANSLTAQLTIECWHCEGRAPLRFLGQVSIAYAELRHFATEQHTTSFREREIGPYLPAESIRERAGNALARSAKVQGFLRFAVRSKADVPTDERPTFEVSAFTQGEENDRAIEFNVQTECRRALAVTACSRSPSSCILYQQQESVLATFTDLYALAAQNNMSAPDRPKTIKGARHAFACCGPPGFSAMEDAAFARQAVAVYQKGLHRIRQLGLRASGRQNALTRIREICQSWQTVADIEILYRLVGDCLQSMLMGCDLYLGLLESGAQSLYYKSASVSSRMQGQRLQRGQGVSFRCIGRGHKPLLLLQHESRRVILIDEARASSPRPNWAREDDGQTTGGKRAHNRSTEQGLIEELHVLGNRWRATLPLLICPLLHGETTVGVLACDHFDHVGHFRSDLSQPEAGVAELLMSAGRLIGDAMSKRRLDEALMALADVLKQAEASEEHILAATLRACLKATPFAMTAQIWKHDKHGQLHVLHCLSSRETLPEVSHATTPLSLRVTTSTVSFFSREKGLALLEADVGTNETPSHHQYCYLQLVCGGLEKRTSLRAPDLDPLDWAETHIWRISRSVSFLQGELWVLSEDNSRRLIATATLRLDSLQKDVKARTWAYLHEVNRSPQARTEGNVEGIVGKLNVEISLQPIEVSVKAHNAEKKHHLLQDKTLQIKIVKALNLQPAEHMTSTCNPFVIVNWKNGTLGKTEVIKRQTEPVWDNEVFNLSIPSHWSSEVETLTCEVWSDVDSLTERSGKRAFCLGAGSVKGPDLMFFAERPTTGSDAILKLPLGPKLSSEAGFEHENSQSAVQSVWNRSAGSSSSSDAQADLHIHVQLLNGVLTEGRVGVVDTKLKSQLRLLVHDVRKAMGVFEDHEVTLANTANSTLRIQIVDAHVLEPNRLPEGNKQGMGYVCIILVNDVEIGRSKVCYTDSEMPNWTQAAVKNTPGDNSMFLAFASEAPAKPELCVQLWSVAAILPFRQGAYELCHYLGQISLQGERLGRIPKGQVDYDLTPTKKNSFPILPASRLLDPSYHDEHIKGILCLDMAWLSLRPTDLSYVDKICGGSLNRLPNMSSRSVYDKLTHSTPAAMPLPDGAKLLRFCVLSCRDLTPGKGIGNVGTYVTVKFAGQELGQTKAVLNTRSPVYEDGIFYCSLADPSADSNLTLEVYDKSQIGYRSLVGATQLTYKETAEMAEQELLHPSGVKAGWLSYSLTPWDPAFSKEVLEIAITGACDLAKADLIGSSDPIVLLFWDGREIARTKGLSNTLDPIWQETFWLHLPRSQGWPGLRIEVWDTDFGQLGDFLGQVNLEAYEITSAAGQRQGYNLQPKESGCNQHYVRGTLFVAIQRRRLTVCRSEAAYAQVLSAEDTDIPSEHSALSSIADLPAVVSDILVAEDPVAVQLRMQKDGLVLPGLTAKTQALAQLCDSLPINSFESPGKMAAIDDTKENSRRGEMTASKKIRHAAEEHVGTIRPVSPPPSGPAGQQQDPTAILLAEIASGQVTTSINRRIESTVLRGHLHDRLVVPIQCCPKPAKSVTANSLGYALVITCKAGEVYTEQRRFAKAIADRLSTRLPAFSRRSQDIEALQRASYKLYRLCCTLRASYDEGSSGLSCCGPGGSTSPSNSTHAEVDRLNSFDSFWQSALGLIHNNLHPESRLLVYVNTPCKSGSRLSLLTTHGCEDADSAPDVECIGVEGTFRRQLIDDALRDRMTLTFRGDSIEIGHVGGYGGQHHAVRSAQSQPTSTPSEKGLSDIMVIPLTTNGLSIGMLGITGPFFRNSLPESFSLQFLQRATKLIAETVRATQVRVIASQLAHVNLASKLGDNSQAAKKEHAERELWEAFRIVLQAVCMLCPQIENVKIWRLSCAHRQKSFAWNIGPRKRSPKTPTRQKLPFKGGVKPYQTESASHNDRARESSASIARSGAEAFEKDSGTTAIGAGERPKLRDSSINLAQRLSTVWHRKTDDRTAGSLTSGHYSHSDSHTVDTPVHYVLRSTGVDLSKSGLQSFDWEDVGLTDTQSLSVSRNWLHALRAKKPWSWLSDKELLLPLKKIDTKGQQMHKGLSRMNDTHIMSNEKAEWAVLMHGNLRPEDASVLGELGQICL